MDFAEKYLRWHARYTLNRMLHRASLLSSPMSEMYVGISSEHDALRTELAEMVKEVDNG